MALTDKFHSIVLNCVDSQVVLVTIRVLHIQLHTKWGIGGYMDDGSSRACGEALVTVSSSWYMSELQVKVAEHLEITN